MLKNAVNRCQATPIVSCREITTAHPADTATLIRANTTIAAGHAGRILPSPVEMGAAHAGYGNHPLAALNPRIAKMQMAIVRMTPSTKYAWAKFDPANRDRRPGRRGRLRWRTTINVAMPANVVNAITSTNSPYQACRPN